MKKILIYSFLCLCSAVGFSQTLRPDSVQPFHGFQPGKVNYHLNLGSEFASTSGYGSGFSNWVSPAISYDVSKKLRLGGGFTVASTTYFSYRPWYLTESTGSFNGNISTATIFVNGQYLVNDRLSIFGSAYKTMPLTNEPLQYNPFNPIHGTSTQGVDLNIGYKVGKNMFIQAGFRYSDGRSPYQNNTFGNPFGGNAFGTGAAFPGSSYNPNW